MPRTCVPKLALALAGGLLVACSGTATDDAAPGGGGADGSDPTQPLAVSVSPPAEPTTLLSGADGAERALAGSRELFDAAPVVVVAVADDVAAQAQGASVAVALGSPLLLAPPPADAAAGGTADGATGDAATSATGTASAGAADALVTELERLGTTTVLAVGDVTGGTAALGEGVEVVSAPGDEAAVAELAGLPVGAAQPVAAADLTRAVAALQRDEPALLRLEPAAAEGSDGASPAPGESAAPADGGSDGEAGTLPAVEAAPALESVVLLAAPDEIDVAAVATARAAGATVLVVEGGDPRRDPAAIAALSEGPLDAVLATGDGTVDAERVRARVDVAATGVELPGGGQLVFPGRRLVALYGHPGVPSLGVLGEQDLDGAIARARELAAEYDDLVEEPVVPTFEIITTVASSSAGGDGDYSNETDVEVIRPWVDAAREAGVYVVLDLQPGRTDFLTQARLYEELLAQPHVGLALDPEWRLQPDEVHLRQIGSVSATEVNAVVDWLADLTAEGNLPQKLLVLHQFTVRMITDRASIDGTRDEVAVMIHMDGNGAPSTKFDTWNVLLRNPPPGAWFGWKNFYDEDSPMLTPAQTADVEPVPWMVTYQ